MLTLPFIFYFSSKIIGRKSLNNLMLYSELTKLIIGCCIEVHKRLGNGFQEVIYQRALQIEMDLAGLNFERELEMPVYYRNTEIATRRVDFLVEGKVIVELKALLELEGAHLAQAINYLQVYKIEVGLLVNFGATSLEFKRVFNNKIEN